MTAKTILAIPDIHGRADLLIDLIGKIAKKYTRKSIKPFNTLKRIVFLGDMIDRGPESATVITIIRHLQTEYRKKIVVLAGNHEWMCIDAACGGKGARDLWMSNGGSMTEMSFKNQYVPRGTVKWMAALPLQYEEDGFFFSHAPVPTEDLRSLRDRGKPYTKEELIWHCSGPMFCRTWKDKIGVCGHIHALIEGLVEPRFYSNYLFCDAGCGCADYAPLVAVDVKKQTYIEARPNE